MTTKKNQQQWSGMMLLIAILCISCCCCNCQTQQQQQQSVKPWPRERRLEATGTAAAAAVVPIPVVPSVATMTNVAAAAAVPATTGASGLATGPVTTTSATDTVAAAAATTTTTTAAGVAGSTTAAAAVAGSTTAAAVATTTPIASATNPTTMAATNVATQQVEGTIQLESTGTNFATTTESAAALPTSTTGTQVGAPVQQDGTAITGVIPGDSTAAQQGQLPFNNESAKQQQQGQGQFNNENAQQQQQQQPQGQYNNDSAQQQQQHQDPCPSARSCTECRTAALVAASTTQGYTCLWTESRYCLLELAQAMPNMCAAENENYYDSEGSSMGSWVVLILLVAGLAYGRFYIMGAGSSSTNFSSVATFVSILNQSKGSNKRGGTSEKHSETIPLASATDDDEEWGWEDSSAGGGDVELMGSFSSARVKDDEALNEALAIQKRQPPSKISMSPPPTKSNSAGAGSHRISSVHHSSAPSPPPMPLHITSLGQKTVNSIKKPPVRAVKKKDDDLFASMGLSSKPTFAPKQPTGVVLGSKQSMMSQSVTSSSTSSWRNAATEADQATVQWDDDGDLDDLLED